MAALVYLSAALSTFFRLSAYVFLRVVCFSVIVARFSTYPIPWQIPGRILTKLLPTLYIVHLSTLPLLSRDKTTPAQHIKTDNDTRNSNKGLVTETQNQPIQVCADRLPTCTQYSQVRYVKQSRASTLKTLLFSLPSTKALTTANVLINTILLLMSADLVLEPYVDNATDVTFTRIGAIYPDSARIVVRYPHENATVAVVSVLWRQATAYGNGAWTAGPAVNLTAANDWTSTGVLDGLWPSTHYEC